MQMSLLIVKENLISHSKESLLDSLKRNVRLSGKKWPMSSRPEIINLIKNNMTHLLEYAEPCEIIEQLIDWYRVKISKPSETIERIIKYEPIPNIFQYDWQLVVNEWKYARLYRYTTYLENWKLTYAYKKKDIARHSDDLVYESEIGSKYIVVTEAPFLERSNIESLLNDREEKKSIFSKKIEEYKNLIKEAEGKLKDIDNEYDIGSKCEHVWILEYEEETNNWKTTKRKYVCECCWKEDNQFWHSLF